MGNENKYQIQISISIKLRSTLMFFQHNHSEINKIITARMIVNIRNEKAFEEKEDTSRYSIHYNQSCKY